YKKYGKLWTYNLNYFDFLNQECISKQDGLILIEDYIKNKESLLDGKEPYPISLRGINWVKFLSKNRVSINRIDKTLYNDFIVLSNNLEYHLLGNHLLENSFSLLFGAYYFQDEKLYLKSKDLLQKELNEQILNDGAHYELSPMYHQILFSRLLDCIHLIKLNSFWKSDDLLMFLIRKASLMSSWLQNTTYQNGEVPMVNDSTYNIAPFSTKLFSFAEKIGISNELKPLSDSGYRKINSKKYELFVDVGNIGPDYQPGHAHSDTFSFELYVKKSPLLVDTGISTYEKNFRRQKERETASHNTVTINDLEQSEVWGGFRVARRAKITSLIEENFFISAKHDGYKRIGFLHERTFKWTDDKIEILDTLNRSCNDNAKAYFHLHSSIEKPIIKKEKVILYDKRIFISFSGYSKIEVLSYKLSNGFNITKPAFKIIVSFDTALKTHIHL
ncbi:MAG: alginate lyase family protein, partial [Flavobacteriaceae bacterium]